MPFVLLIFLLIAIIASLIKPELLVKKRAGETQIEYKKRYKVQLVIAIIVFVLSMLRGIE